MMSLLFVQWLAVALMIISVLRVAWIDMRFMLIPDEWNITIASLGLLYHLPSGTHEIVKVFAIASLMLMTMIATRWLHYQFTGKIGLGLGDVKFIAAATIWITPWNLPLFFLIASGSALVYAFKLTARRSDEIGNLRVPFGPFLGGALILTVLSEIAALFPFISEGIL